MTSHAQERALPVRGWVDAGGRLIEADPRLADLHRRAGGVDGGQLAVPQLASIARLARRLGINISRSVIAADGDLDLDLWVRAQPQENGVELGIVGWNERSARSNASDSERERQSDFLRASGDWAWETDEKLDLMSLSPNAAAAVDKAPINFVGKQLSSFFRFVETPDGNFPILGALVEKRSFEGQMAEVRGKPGLLCLLRGVPLIDGAGNFSGFKGRAACLPPTDARDSLHVVPDASSDPSAFGERLDQALRGPLDNIIANAETISEQQEGPLRRDYAGYARDIAAAGRHLLELVDDLVDLHAIERPDFVPETDEIDLADLARRAAGLLAVRAAERQVRIDQPGDDEILSATGEFTRVLQILMNLISNAIRYSPEGGMVWIRTEQEGDLSSVIVADQGKGIAEADQARIFEKFERIDPSEPGGTGLGLYIARRLARAMGGDISVDSAPGQGARFTLTLPSRARSQ